MWGGYGGRLRSSLQLFVVSGYCVFEDDACVDLLGVLDGKPSYANITFSGFFVGPCVDRPKVIDKGPAYAAGLLSGFHAGARCPSKVRRSRCKAEIRRTFKRSTSVSSFFSTFSSFFFFFFSFFFLFFFFFFYCYDQSSMVAYTHL